MAAEIPLLHFSFPPTTTTSHRLHSKFFTHIKTQTTTPHLLFPKKPRKPTFPCHSSSSYSISTPKPTSKSSPIPRTQIFSEGREEDEKHRLICPGCGVFMQDSNPNFLGYYQKPTPPPQPLSQEEPEDSDDLINIDDDSADWSSSKSNLGDEFDGLDYDVEDEEFDADEFLGAALEKSEVTSTGLKQPVIDDETVGFENWEFDELEDEYDEKKSEVTLTTFDLGGKELPIDETVGFEDWENDNFEDKDDYKKWRRELDGFGPAGVGYGNITEETLAKMWREKLSKSNKKKKMREDRRREAEGANMAVVCARCHSLRYYGQLKNDKAENLIPDFDFDKFISARLMKPASSAPVVVLVVDCADFDGSFPKRAAKSLFAAFEGGKHKLTTLPKLVLVATKVDLLPSQVSPTRLDRWVRNRARAAGAPKLNAVFLVSAHKDMGVRNLIAYFKKTAGPRGNVWVIGAQNAGKSTLINSLAKKEGAKLTRLTEAAVPGTTLGILRVTGVLPAKTKMYDTPGLLHPHLMTMRLTREEQKMVEIRKQLKPRTFRIKAGQTVLVGGLMRLDLVEASVETIYVTVWASLSVSLHFGKTENADEMHNKHFGIRLQPPIGQHRITQLGDWKQKEIKISGASWDMNSVDIAVSGLGWFSLGLKGEASVALWTFDGIEVTEREPLVLDRAQFLERPGFLLSKAISDAISEESRKKSERKVLQINADFLLEPST